MPYEVKLKIADIIIQMQSKFSLEQLSEQEKKEQVTERFHNFFYNGRQKPHIRIEVKIVDKLPKICNKKNIFITYHFEDGEENWRLCKRNDTYIYKSPLEDKRQLMLVNRTFDKVTAYLLPKVRGQRSEVSPSTKLRTDGERSRTIRSQESEVRERKNLYGISPISSMISYMSY